MTLRTNSFDKAHSTAITTAKGCKKMVRANSINLRNFEPAKLALEKTLSFKNLVQETRKSESDYEKVDTSKLPEPAVMFSPRPVSELDAAAVKLQKVYKSYRTRRNLADCAVVVEELWWKALDFAALKRSSVSFFNDEKPETAVSRWARARTRAAKVGKGLSKDEKAQKLALQHWLEAIDPTSTKQSLSSIQSTQITPPKPTPQTINMRFSTIALIAGAGVANAQVQSLLSSVAASVASSVGSALPGASGASSALSSVQSSLGSQISSVASSANAGASSAISSIEASASSQLASLSSEAATATGSAGASLSSRLSSAASAASSAAGSARSSAASAASSAASSGAGAPAATAAPVAMGALAGGLFLAAGLL